MFNWCSCYLIYSLKIIDNNQCRVKCTFWNTSLLDQVQISIHKIRYRLVQIKMISTYIERGGIFVKWKGKVYSQLYTMYTYMIRQKFNVHVHCTLFITTTTYKSSIKNEKEKVLIFLFHVYIIHFRICVILAGYKKYYFKGIIIMFM